MLYQFYSLDLIAVTLIICFASLLSTRTYADPLAPFLLDSFFRALEYALAIDAIAYVSVHLALAILRHILVKLHRAAAQKFDPNAAKK